jgi:hypothetical protein
MKSKLPIGILFSALICNYAEAQKLPDLIPFRSGKLWGYCDSNKKVIIKPAYKPPLGEAYSFPLFPDNATSVQIETDKFIYIINRKGKVLDRVPFQPEEPVEQIREVQDGDSKQYDYNRPYIMKGKYGELCFEQMFDGHSYIGYRDAGGTERLIEGDEKVIYEGYNRIVPIDTLYVLRNTKGKSFLGDRFGNIITKSGYDMIDANRYANRQGYASGKLLTTDRTGFAVIENNGYGGLIRLDGKVIIKPNKYQYIRPAVQSAQGVYLVLYKNKYGYINLKGTEYWKD